MTEPAERLAAALADRYTIERELGHGGMATVYLAQDLKHDRKVAIKVLRPELAAAIGAERFLQEIHVTARLRHPNILPLYDSGEAGGALYYVAPLVEGGSLANRLARGPIPAAEAITIAREVADALGYAHAQGVVHRDIKPDNILLESGHAVVADFGIARALSAVGGERITATGLAIGTPLYMSPEQAGGEAAIDGRTDIYALGAVLYEMLSGRPPFQGPTYQALIAAVMTGVPTPLPRSSGVSPAVDTAVRRALAKLPAERFATAGEFGEALQSAAAPAAGPTRRFLAPVGAALLLLAAFFVWRGRTATPAPLATRLVQQTFDEAVEESPAWSPDGKALVFSRTVDGYRNLFLRTLDGDERRLTTGPRDDIQAGFDPRGGRIAFVRATAANSKLEPGDVHGWYAEGGDVWTLDLATGAEALLIAKAFSPSWSPDGGAVAVEASWGGPRRIWVTDGNGRNPYQASDDSSEVVVHMTPRWSPDGKRLVFRRIQQLKSDIMVADPATRRTTWVTHDDIVDVDPAWSPSGKWIYFSSSRGGGLNIWRVAVTPDGAPRSAPQQLTTGAGEDLGPSISPDGHRMVFATSQLDADLWRLPLDPVTGRPTGPAQAVVATTRVDSRGAWSHDGTAIAFNSDRRGDMNLWLHDVASGTDRQLTNGPGGDYQPNWAPDGKSIAFFSARSGQDDIWTVDVASGALHRLTTAPGIHTNPFFSPDGRLIAFHADRDGRFQPWVMNADGTGQRQLSRLGTSGHFMLWSADGKSLTFKAEPPSGAQVTQVDLTTGVETAIPGVAGGSHMSASPDHRKLLDVKGHKVLWITPLDGAAPYQVFEFPDPAIRIDYPTWSPDGRWVLFEHAAPRGGDIWLLEGIE